MTQGPAPKPYVEAVQTPFMIEELKRECLEWEQAAKMFSERCENLSALVGLAKTYIPVARIDDFNERARMLTLGIKWWVEPNE